MVRGIVAITSIIAAAAVALAADARPAPSIPSTVAAAIDWDVQNTMTAANVPGATIAVVEHGKFVYARGYGVRDLTDGTAAADADTAYEIGSLTKQFTAAAILQLRAAGKISLDAPLATYLPDVPHAAEVTIRQLLAQTTGFPEYLAGPDVAARAGTPATFDDLMARIAGKPLAFRPGTRWQYANTNDLILGRVIEIVSGQTWDAYVENHLFTLAGLQRTATIAGENRLTDMARGSVAADGRVVPSPPLSESWASAAGGIVSTAADLDRWATALAAGRIVSSADYRLLTTPQTLADGSSTGYGFGFYIDTLDGQPRIWHDGNTFGFDASDQYFPTQDVRIIVLTNAADGRSDELAARIFNDLFPAIAARAHDAAPGQKPALAGRFAPLSEPITADTSGADIYRLALERMRSVPAPPYLQYKLHVVTTYHADTVTQNFLHVERTAGRKDKIRNIDLDFDREFIPFEVVPDLFLGHTAAPAVDVNGLSVGLDDPAAKPLKTIGKVVHTQLHYTVTRAGVDDLARCPAAIHLRLEPLSDPMIYNLRDLWIDAASGAICRANAVYRAHINFTMTDATITLDLDADGLIDRYRSLVTVHLLFGTDSALQVAAYDDILTVDEAAWTTAPVDDR
jgi:CubicO group peptidase (beta-lactamase class C family)